MPEAHHLTESVDSLTPGVYFAESDTEAYGSLQAAILSGAGKFLGEDWIGDTRSIAVKILAGTGAHRNNPPPSDDFVGIVQIGDQFYSRALEEYHPPMLMWWRETIQNSVDAGGKYFAGAGSAIEIRCKIEDLADGTQRLTCEDNCGGMTFETLQKNFLTISASGKRGDTGGIGGFGIAKELILFPWLGYEIYTQDVLVTGFRADYKGKRVEKLDGTRVTVVVQNDAKVKCSPVDAIAVIQRSYLPGVKFFVNGERIYADLDAGPLLENFQGNGLATMHHRPRARNNKGFFIRKVGPIGSLFMFTMSVDSNVPGALCLELTAPSTDVLTAQRNKLRYPLDYRVEDFLRRLSRDKSKALEEKEDSIHEVWDGAEYGRESSNQEMAAVLSQLAGSTQNFFTPEFFVEAKKKIEEHLVKTGEKVGESESDEEATTARPIMPPELLQEVAEPLVEQTTKSTTTMDNTIRLITWEAKFYLHVPKKKFFSPPVRFKPTKSPTDPTPTMAPTLKKILRFWGELVRAIMISYDDAEFKPYGIGWIFATELTSSGDVRIIQGEHISKAGEKYLLLNPFKGGDVHGELYSLRDNKDLVAIWSIALHECAHHLGVGSDGHDDVFARTFTDLEERSGHVRTYLKKIRDAVVRRPAGWTPAPRRAPGERRVPLPRFNEDEEKRIDKAVREIKKGDWVSSFYFKDFNIVVSNEYSDNGQKLIVTAKQGYPSYSKKVLAEKEFPNAEEAQSDVNRFLRTALQGV